MANDKFKNIKFPYLKEIPEENKSFIKQIKRLFLRRRFIGIVEAINLRVEQLSAIVADMGDITAGTITLNNSGHVKSGQTDYNKGIGFWLGYTGGLTNSHSLNLEESSDQYLKITDGDQDGLDLSGDCSFEFWMKMKALPSTYLGGNPVAMLIFKWAYGIGILGDNKLFITFYDGANTRFFIADVAFSAGDVGEWVHIAVTFDISTETCVIYKNGIVIPNTAGGSAIGGSLANTAVDVSIGYDPNSAQTFDGKLDDLRIWSDIRTADEILNLFTSELQGNEPNLEGYWKFNNNALDETANGNDLTEVNTPTYDPNDVPFTQGVDAYKFSIGNPDGSFMTWNGYELRLGNIFLGNLKSGATQAAAGAIEDEAWKTDGHATLPDNVLMIGV